MDLKATVRPGPGPRANARAAAAPTASRPVETGIAAAHRLHAEGPPARVEFTPAGSPGTTLGGGSEPSASAGALIAGLATDQAGTGRRRSWRLGGGGEGPGGRLADLFAVARRIGPETRRRLVHRGDAATGEGVAAAPVRTIEIDIAALEAAKRSA